MSNIDELKNIPDVSFIDDRSLEEIQNELLNDYSEEYQRLTGTTGTLSASDPARLILTAASVQIYQLYAYVDRAGKMNMLKYAEGDYLDNLGAFKGVTRKDATYATVKMQYRLGDIRASATGIPGGSRVTDESGNIFATDEYAEIPAGELSTIVSATALDSGTQANDIYAGTINAMVDIIPYIDSVSNISTSAGGATRQTDDDYTQDIYNAPSGYSVAGPEDAYIFHAKRYRQDVEDVKIVSPKPMYIDVYFLLTDGKLPTEEDCAGMEAYLSEEDIRPLGDKVSAKAPGMAQYRIDFRYYINRSDSNKAASIQNSVNNAVNEYIAWQHRLGIDINPSELIRKVVAAGAKRIEVTEPAYQKVEDTEVAVIDSISVTYEGLEDD